MRIDASILGLTQAQTDELVNNLLVDLNEFSEIACMDGQAYGVSIPCPQCTIKMNLCSRQHLLRALVNAQATAERHLHFDVTPRYHMDTIQWNGERGIRVRPGVVAVNVKQQFTYVAAYPISPYVIEDAPVEDVDGVCIVTLDKTYITNPGKAFIRDQDGNLLRQQRINGYPRRDVDGDWLVALDKDLKSPCTGVEQINVQHCELMYVDVTDTACADDGVLVPTYPNSTQIIPQAKPSEDLGATRRFWFHPWVLLDEAFDDEGADLTRNEFYKLQQTVDFQCVAEVEALPTSTWREFSCECVVSQEEDDDMAISIIDPVRGYLEVDAAAFRCGTCSGSLPCSCGVKFPLNLTVYYKTDPALLGVNDSLGNIASAIAHLAAAELPLSACACVITEGFIAAARESYNESRINQVTGDVIVNVKFGNTHGHHVYLQQIGRVPKQHVSYHI